MKEAAPPLAEGRYQLISVLGVGGMATVYRGFDARLQVQRAIKVLSPALARRKSLRTRFEAEATTMAMLHHRHIVGVYDVGTDGNRTYIVMELVEGGSLLDRVREFGPLPPKMALSVTIKTLDALRMAHSKGVVHRDIKPHNILLTRDGDIRITDFGIAQMRKWEDDGLTKTGAVMGTWGFMAPEQRQDAKTVDPRADVYSTGATLYSVLTDKTPVDLFAADMDASMLDGLIEPLAEVIRKSTRYSREERYPDATAMADACRAVLDQLEDDPPDTPPLALPAKTDPDEDERRPAPRPRRQGGFSEQSDNAEVSEPEDAPAPEPAQRVSDMRHGTLVPAIGADLDMITTGASSPSAFPPDDEELVPDPPSDEIARRAGLFVQEIPEHEPETELLQRPAPTPPPEPVTPVPSEPRVELRANPGDIEPSGAMRAVITSMPPAAPPATVPAAPAKPGIEFWVTAAIAVLAIGAVILLLVLQPWKQGPPTVVERIVERPAAPVDVPTSPEVKEAAPEPTPPAAGDPVKPNAKATVSPANNVKPTPPSGPATTTPEATTVVQVVQNPSETTPTPPPVEAPRILHNPPKSAKVGTPLTFNAQLPSERWTVTLYYRPASGGAFTERPMRGQGGLFGTQLDVTAGMAGGLQYHIKAVPADGGPPLTVGSGFSPVQVAVTP